MTKMLCTYHALAFLEPRDVPPNAGPPMMFLTRQRVWACDSRSALLALEPLVYEYLVDDQHTYVIFPVE